VVAILTSECSIRHYLTNNNVQLGATYGVGKLSTAKYNAAITAAAKYVNAREDEIGRSLSKVEARQLVQHGIAIRDSLAS
jgi:selenocysteine lyase/cysteine desulfurase